MKFRKKPVVIDAVQWKGDNLLEVIKFTDGSVSRNSKAAERGWDCYVDLVRDKGFKLYTLEGLMDVSIGSWVIKGVKGEHYACKPDIFDMTYEAVDSPQLTTLNGGKE